MTTDIKPASDREIARYNGDVAIYQRDPVDRYLHCVQCDASPGGMGGHRPGCDFKTWPRIKARIDSDRAKIAALETGLESIAANTCCDRCQEAALVARAALQRAKQAAEPEAAAAQAEQGEK